MKTIISIFISIISSFSVLAGYNDGRLTVNLPGKGEYFVNVDNNRYQLENNSLVINSLTPGYHTVQIYRANERRNIFSGKSTNLQMLYNSSVYIKPQVQVDITINRSGKAVINESSLNRNRGKRQRGNNDDRYSNNRDNPYNNDRNNGNYPYGSDRNDQYDNGQIRGNERWNGFLQPINDNAFENLRQILRRENFESRRLQTAVDAVERNYFSISQVKRLMQLFSFENNKLELAKQAYKNTVDKNNYFLLSDEFSYNRSKQEFEQYVRQYR